MALAQAVADVRRSHFRAVLMIAALALANGLAWFWAFATFGNDPTLMGVALLAWVFGLRHAVDADHIAAIDNVVRKLMQEGRQPLGVGLFFSLGHSTIVLLAALAIGAGAAILQDDLEAFGAVGGIIGTSVSAFFLLLIGIANLVILVGVWRTFKRARQGAPVTEESLDMLLSGGGFLARLFRPLFAMIRRSWHMYPLGFLFGLGFDTATEVGVLTISATQAASGMSLADAMVFPVLFTVGMALVDSLDNVLMVNAYGWAFADPLRKLWYNVTITAVSVVIAFLIGGLEALGLIAEHFDLTGGIWALVAGLNDDLANFGFLVVGIFMAAWLASYLIYRWRGFGRPAAS